LGLRTGYGSLIPDHEIFRDQKSRRSPVGNATRTAFSTQQIDQSCPTASRVAGKKPNAAATIPTMLAAIPPSALCKAIRLMR
jgi:hypothetical protein